LIVPFLGLFSFGVIFLEKLTEVDQMDLDFEVALPDILFNALEGFLLFFELLFLDFEGFVDLVHLAPFFEQFGSRGNCLKLDVR
jgi:hypothetical protein